MPRRIFSRTMARWLIAPLVLAGNASSAGGQQVFVTAPPSEEARNAATPIGLFALEVQAEVILEQLELASRGAPRRCDFDAYRAALSQLENLMRTTREVIEYAGSQVDSGSPDPAVVDPLDAGILLFQLEAAYAAAQLRLRECERRAGIVAAGAGGSGGTSSSQGGKHWDFSEEEEEEEGRKAPEDLRLFPLNVEIASDNGEACFFGAAIRHAIWSINFGGADRASFTLAAPANAVTNAGFPTAGQGARIRRPDGQVLAAADTTREEDEPERPDQQGRPGQAGPPRSVADGDANRVVDFDMTVADEYGRAANGVTTTAAAYVGGAFTTDDQDERSEREEAPGAPVRSAEPAVPFVVKATYTARTATNQQPVAGQQVRLFPESIRNVALPFTGSERDQADASEDPLMCVTRDDGTCVVPVGRRDAATFVERGPGLPAGFERLEISLPAARARSVNILAAAGTTFGPMERMVTSRMDAGNGRTWTSMMASTPIQLGALQTFLGGLSGNRSIFDIEEDECRTKQQAAPNDPYFSGRGAWGQDHADQWAIQRVGLTAGADSAWRRLGPNPQPVIVAVVDSGLDWNHLDFSWDNIWRNDDEVPGNGVDDDGNGFVDDIIGWDFVGNSNEPWDHDGHGTLVAGIIAADTGNATGIAGINPHARIMVLKALNAFGHARASWIANAIKYAADNGARVINISAGGPGLTGIERDAIAYARGRGAVIVVASGNDGINVQDYGPAGVDGVLTVAAASLDDSHPTFSNWGPAVEIAAPGVDVLSLRARRTDTVRGIPGVEYRPGEAYVGEDRRYYRVSGTSFAAPIVAGVASLILSRDPSLTGEQVESILVQSARDIQTPGRDNFSGAGLVDARAALGFDPAVRIEAAISGVEIVQGPAGPAVRVNGTIAADRLAAARIDIGVGRDPDEFRTVARELAAATGALAEIPADNFRGSQLWTIRLVVSHANGTEREARFLLDVGG